MQDQVLTQCVEVQLDILQTEKKIREASAVVSKFYDIEYEEENQDTQTNMAANNEQSETNEAN